MATTILTGRDLVLTIDGDSYDSQATSITMALETDQQEVSLIDGTNAYKTVNTTGTLTVVMLQDWGAVGSLCEALFTATKTAPDTALAFSFTANTGAVFAGNVYPVYPESGGEATSPLEVTCAFKIQDGDVTLS